MFKVSGTYYAPVAGAQLKPSSGSAPCFGNVGGVKVQMTSTSGQGTHTTTSVFSQAGSRLQEPRLQNKVFFSQSAYNANAGRGNHLGNTGRIQAQSVQFPKPHISKMSRSLQSNFNLANRIVGEISRAIPNPINSFKPGRVYHQGPPATTVTSSTRQQVFSPHRPHLNGSHTIHRHSVELGPRTWGDYFQRTDNVCRGSGMGNRAELAAMACKSLRDNGAKHVDYVMVTDGRTNNTAIPHAFAVVGRTTNVNIPGISTQHYISGQFSNAGNLGLPNQWNNSAVICDPWSQNAYPVQDFNQFWGDLKAFCKSPTTFTCNLLHRLP